MYCTKLVIQHHESDLSIVLCQFGNYYAGFLSNFREGDFQIPRLRCCFWAEMFLITNGLYPMQFAIGLCAPRNWNSQRSVSIGSGGRTMPRPNWHASFFPAVLKTFECPVTITQWLHSVASNWKSPSPFASLAVHKHWSPRTSFPAGGGPLARTRLHCKSLFGVRASAQRRDLIQFHINVVGRWLLSGMR